MTCIERKRFEDLERKIENLEKQHANEIAVYKRRIQKERKEKKMQYQDIFFLAFSAFCLLAGTGIFLYVLAGFSHWCEYGW